MLEQGRPQPVREDVASGMEARLTALEDAVAELRHFISSEQRPDLTVLVRDSTAAAVYPDTE